MYTISAQQFLDISGQLFCKVGATEATAQTVAQILLESSLSGYDSHGIMRVPRYVRDSKDGVILPHESPSVRSVTNSISVINGNFSFGPLTAKLAVDTSVELALSTGIGVVTTHNTNDVARLGSYLRPETLKQCIVLIFANDAGAGAAVSPFGGVRPFLSTNPIGVGIPRRDHEPIIIDISTASTAVGKLSMALNQGRNLEEKFLITKDGTLSDDPRAFFTDRPNGAAILPLGGLASGHKGFALSILVEVLAGALSGSGMSKGILQGTSLNGLFVCAFDPEKFCGLSDFYAQVEQFIELIKKEPTSPWCQEILMPGERALRERTRRERDGIPVDEVTWKQIQ